MTLQTYDERRLAPRVPVDGQTLSVVTARSVRVIDIGLGGALLACLPPVPQGGTLRLALGSAPFASVIDIRHRRHDDRTGEVRVGVTFVRMTAASRDALEQFLARAGKQN
ncbi:MAG TPA: PilZ domain-containing protein [Vicinamibacterales bacterium]|nr:PilZ domain-containing protein [Vicinamibacterales bacterium]